jgi:hypothetical protein
MSAQSPQQPSIGYRTVDGKVTKSGTSGPLHLDIWILEKEEDRVESVAVDGPYI